MKHKHKTVRLLLIDWVDSSGSPGWKASDELKAEIAECQSIGFFVSETKKAIALALNRSTLAGFKPFGEVVSIPKKCIVRKRVLLRVRAPK